jgi:glycosyltransferase involved in cell wall biosynthesis
MNPKRILHINTMDRNGGAAQLAFNLLEATNAAGHTAHMAVRAKHSASDQVFEIANEESRHAWARFCTKSFRQANGSQRLARALGRPLSSARVMLGHEDFDFPGTWNLLNDSTAKPDLIHLHNLHGHYFDLRALPWLSRQVPTVVTLHDAWMLSGHCSHGFDCDRWRSGCGQCPDLSIYPAIPRDATAYNWRRKQHIYSQSKLHVVAPAQWLMNKAKDSMLAPAMVSSRVIPHGIDLSIFKTGDRSQARLDLDLPPDVTILLFAATGIRNNIWKDYQTMRRAFEILGNRSGRQKLIFLALGEDAPPEQIGDCELRFIAHTSSRMTLAKFYQAADVYIHGAKAEAWGLTITEAMACGLPVVASDVGGIPDQVAEGQSGFLVPVGAAELMAARIGMLVDDDSLRDRMGQHACKRAHNEFGLSHMTHHYLSYYETILAHPTSFHQ